MFIPRIYYPHPLAIDEILTLNTETTHYLIKVLRLKEKDNIILFNGHGGEFSAILHLQKKTAQAQLVAFHDKNTRSLLKLHLGQGVSRGDRMDFAIQKATELGVTSITPLLTANCLVKLSEATAQKRAQHWENIAISASEQCGRIDVPIIHAAIALTDWSNQSFEGTSIVLQADSPFPLNKIKPVHQIRLAIGPESGFQDSEIKLMLAKNFTACHLGPRILRTETAGIAALSILQGFFGDLG